jgi:hypothetical protein
MVEYIICLSAPAERWGLLPATRLANRKILIEQNVKKLTAPALCVLCGERYELQVQRLGSEKYCLQVLRLKVRDAVDRCRDWR